MKWASTSGERAALPTSEENLFIQIQGVKILNGDKLVWYVFLGGTVKMQESSSSLEECPLWSCAHEVVLILQEKEISTILDFSDNFKVSSSFFSAQRMTK